MIHQILPRLAEDLADFLESKFDHDEPVALSTIVGQDGNMSVDVEDKVIMTMVGIERDGSYSAAGSSYSRGDIPVHINLYILFSANFNDYPESLRCISGVIGYFQGNPTFSDGGETVKIEMFNIDFRELGSLWTGLGAKYMPSVLYRMRTLNMDEGNITDEIPAIGGITV